MFDKLSKTDWQVFQLLAKDYRKAQHIREIATNLKISPSSAKRAAEQLLKLNLIKEEKIANLRRFSGNIDSTLFKELKRTMNIEMILPLVEKIDAYTIVLYGSMATGTDTEKSDIDIMILTNTKNNNISFWNEHEVQLIQFSPAQWDKQKRENKGYYNEVHKGIILKGSLP